MTRSGDWVPFGDAFLEAANIKIKCEAFWRDKQNEQKTENLGAERKKIKRAFSKRNNLEVVLTKVEVYSAASERPRA